MTKSFSPRLDILPPAQRRLWDELRAVPSEFVLYGGTALALHLGHRDSVDFDFFANCAIDPDAVYRTVAFLKGSQITQNEPNTLTCLVDRDGPIKVSFFGVPHVARLSPPCICADNGLKVASLIDIAATKAAVVQRRAEAKDYIDIDALLTAGVSLPQALAAARQVFGDAFVPVPTLKALTYFGDKALKSVPKEVQARLVKAVATVDPLRLPSLNREPGKPPTRDGGRSR